MVLGTLAIHMQKDEVGPLPKIMCKIYSKQIKELNLQALQKL